MEGEEKTGDGNHASSFREFISNRHLWIALTRGWNPCGCIPFLRNTCNPLPLPSSPSSHGVQNFVSRTALCVPRLSLFNTWCRITEPRFPKRFQRGSCPRIYGIKIRSVITFRRKSEAGLLMGGDKGENERYEIGRGGLASLEISDKPISRNNEDRAPRLF